MKLVVLAIITAGCGGRSPPPAALPPPPPVPDVSATRWVPAAPSYAFASRSIEVAQDSLRGAIDLLGSLAGFELSEVIRGISDVLAVDALHPDPVAAIGVDPHGSWAVFSDDLNPTLVVHLAAPELMTAFLDRQRERGLVTRSVIVDAGGSGPANDKIEVFSANQTSYLEISWAIAGDWMWIHVAPRALHDDAARWFTASHAPHAAAWTDHWAWAARAAGTAARVVGFVEPRGAIANALARSPDAVACTKLFALPRRIAVAVEGDGQRVAARLAFDVGSTDRVRALILPPPTGWDATAAHAPIAAQWNLDIPTLRSWLEPCLGMFDPDIAALDATGARAARGLVLDFDPDAKSGTAAVALDVARPAYFAQQLDRIPLRKTLERARTFGRHKGFSLTIPFAATIEYVVEDQLVLAALGEGVIARLVAPHAGPTEPAPIFAVDLAPPAMPVGAWASAIHAVLDRDLSSPPGLDDRRAAERLQRWRDIHIAMTAEPTALVLTMSGHRR
jgi:hypothetical protein